MPRIDTCMYVSIQLEKSKNVNLSLKARIANINLLIRVPSTWSITSSVSCQAQSPENKEGHWWHLIFLYHVFPDVLSTYRPLTAIK